MVSGEGGAAEGGSDGAAREGGKRDTTPLMLTELLPEISYHSAVSMNLCGALGVKRANTHFVKFAHRLETVVSVTIPGLSISV